MRRHGDGGGSVGAPPRSSGPPSSSGKRLKGSVQLPAKRSNVVLAAMGCLMFIVVLAPLFVYLSSLHQQRSLRDQLPSYRRAKQAAPPAVEAPVDMDAALEVELDHDPVVVLSTGNGKWNTGVWTGFGDERPTLNWAAAGVVVDKSQCPYKCVFTHDQSFLPNADAVLMELVNHPKFLGVNTREPVPWPPKRATTRPGEVALPLIGNFYMEPPSAYPAYTTDPALKEHVDFTVGPDVATSDFPITLICPWGKPLSEFLKPPPAKAPGYFMAYFNEHGVAPEYREYVSKVAKLLGPEDFHAYNHMRNRQLPPEASGNLANRLAFLGKYKFALVTEPVMLKDWIEPDWSHTLIAGTIPVYIGAPNIISYTPGRRSFIDIRDFDTPEALVARLREVADNPALYNDFFAWKKLGLAPQFSTALANCAHYAECRVCKHVRGVLAEEQQRRAKAAEIASFS